MSSSKGIEDYFAGMAKKNEPQKETYIMKQRGRGIGKGKRNSNMFRISKSESIAPVQQSIQQAKSEIAFNKGGIKRKHRSKSSSVGRKHRKKRSTSKKQKKTQHRSKKSKKGNKKGKRKSKAKKRKKDIFN